MPTATRRHAHESQATVARFWSGIERNHAGPHGPACSEIEMIVRTYRFPNDLARELAKVAGRPNLTADEQIHLIDATFDEIAYPNEQVKVLLPLASSPALQPEARFHLSTNIHRISFQSERERVFRALQQNPQTRGGNTTIEQSATAETPEAVQGGTVSASASEMPEKNE
jgi:hypothetical protein